ncbi:hypothetical protein [Streptomyces sp. NPDC097619]|uniref:hypothetical protein n=1 Tax=Streptomyces sp. NPDC097619 TaxID=3157228 RepID=UPI0033192399
MTDTVRHPDVAEISDLTEGLLSPARTTEVRDHLTGCALCSDVRASLEEIRGLLGTLPGPQRMPGDIVGRIDAALAAEALLSATAPEDRAPATDSGPDADDVSRETAPRRQTARKAPDRPAGTANGSHGPGRTRRRRYYSLLGAAALCVGILGGGGLLLRLVDGGSADMKKAATAPATGTHQEFTQDGLGTAVRDLLGGDAPEAGVDRGAKTEPQADTFGEASVSGPKVRSASPSEVPTCVTAGTGRTDSLLAFERGTYQGRDAFLLVLPHSGDSGRADAYVVDASCADSTAGKPGSVLLKSTYPRP